MRPPVPQWLLSAVVVLAAAGCSSRDTPPAPATSAATAAAKKPSAPPPAVPPTSSWALDPENSSVTFVCKHVFTNVRGMFQRPSGKITVDEASPARSKVEATIDVSSITTGVAERDAHLQSADFFDAAKYPVITFASTQVSSSSRTAFTVVGDLATHGVTKPVTLAVTLSPPFDHAGGIRRSVEATTSVNRRDFGLLWDFPGEESGVVVGDIIQITIDAELVLVP